MSPSLDLGPLLAGPKDALAKLPPPARAAIGMFAALVGYVALDALLPKGMPFGIVVVGVVVGSLYGLVAVGIVLVYRANKVVNFAQAEFGSVAAVLAIELVLVWKVNFFLAVGAGLVIAAAMGALVDILIIRRFANAPRLILAVATIGLAQIFNGVAILLPLLFSNRASGRFAVPIDGSVLIEPVFFSANHVTAVVVAVLAMGGLGLFLARSSYGIAIRAAAENGDRANLLGVPTRHLSTIVWSLAAALSAAATMLRVPIVGFASFASVSGAGSSLLLRTLAAAVIGRMQSIPRTLAAAIALGVFQETANWNVPRTTVVDAMLVVIILVSLVVQRDLLSRVAETGISTWTAIREVRPVPEELRHLPEVKIPSVLVKVGLLAFALFLPAWASDSRAQLAGLVLIYAIVALSLLVLTGWAGHISLGQFALVGFGGATTALLYGRHGWSYLLALPVGVLVSAAVAFVIGLPSLRIRGPFLAVTTLGFAVTSHTYFLEDRYFPWFVQDRIERPVLWQRLPIREEWQVYYLALVGLLAVIFAVRMLRTSHTGRALIAVRDNESAVAANRLDVTRLKLVAFLISGAIAGFAGGLYVVSQQGLATDAFAPEVSLRLFSMVVIGGLGSVPGAIMGAVYVRGAEFFLPPAWTLIASGAGLLLLLLFIPEGLSGILYKGRDAYLRTVARRRDLVVPSLLADERREDVAAAVRVEATDSSGRPEGVLLSIRNLDVSYGQTQVLFGVDLDVKEGELLALLGTNGAGKSTLLKAISGLNTASRGSVLFENREIRNAGPNKTARSGIAQVPGGRGVFPTLTVAENLRIASWMFRKDTVYVQQATKEALENFPSLSRRWDTPAGALSGGEQQMLSLAQAFLAKPKLLMIDELSLGLAPGIVERLVEIVRAIHALGTTIIVVEQSVTTALRLAERALFMEKGEVRFSGPTSDLLDRPDVLRSVFLEGAGVSMGAGGSEDEQPAIEISAMAVAADGPAVPRNAAEILGRPVVLEAIELRKRYGGVIAVDGVSIQVHAGQIHGLLGANGAGKTTLFDLLSGFVPSDGGRLLLAGEDITARPAHERARLGLSRSFQDARLWPSLTVAEAIAVALGHGAPMTNPVATMFGLPAVERSERAIRQRTAELVELFGLAAFRDKFISELSTGSRRMVEIATLLAEEPKVLLLDEPSSGIAQRETEALGGVIRRIQRSTGCAIVIIEHDMPLLTSVADHITALELGAVVTTGVAAEVLHHPQVVASYLGGAVELADGSPRTRTRRRRTKELV